MSCQHCLHHGTRAGLAGVSQEAEGLVEAGVEVSEDAGLDGARATADAGAGRCLVQASRCRIGVPHMVLFTGRIIQ